MPVLPHLSAVLPLLAKALPVPENTKAMPMHAACHSQQSLGFPTVVTARRPWVSVWLSKSCCSSARAWQWATMWDQLEDRRHRSQSEMKKYNWYWLHHQLIIEICKNHSSYCSSQCSSAVSPPASPFFWSQQVWSVWVGDGQQAKQVLHWPQLALIWMKDETTSRSEIRN